MKQRDFLYMKMIRTEFGNIRTYVQELSLNYIFSTICVLFIGIA